MIFINMFEELNQLYGQLNTVTNLSTRGITPIASYRRRKLRALMSMISSTLDDLAGEISPPDEVDYTVIPSYQDTIDFYNRKCIEVMSS